MPSNPPSKPHGGLPFALGAYLIWGLLPLYLRLVHEVPPFEFVGWRILFTLPFCLLFIALRQQGADLRAALANRHVVLLLVASSVLIAVNWLVYISAIQQGHVLASSLGYYINPLVNVVFGTLFLREKLSGRQWAAVALAAAGVSLLAWNARDMLWISLTLAVSFSAYGLVRKLVPVGSLPGLTIESGILVIPAALVVWHYAASPAGTMFGDNLRISLLMALSGVLTAVPLLLFALAARRMDYSALGFVQFLSPTLVFVIGLTVFHEPLKPLQLACFALIWSAIALFVWDLLARRRSAEKPPA